MSDTMTVMADVTAKRVEVRVPFAAGYVSTFSLDPKVARSLAEALTIAANAVEPAK